METEKVDKTRKRARLHRKGPLKFDECLEKDGGNDENDTQCQHGLDEDGGNDENDTKIGTEMALEEPMQVTKPC